MTVASAVAVVAPDERRPEMAVGRRRIALRERVRDRSGTSIRRFGRARTAAATEDELADPGSTVTVISPASTER